jgi:uncharacterized membrane protein YccC
MSRKRAPGAGRKPKGEFKGKKSQFSTRITAETRRALDDAARRSNQSVSQAAEYLLRTVLQKPSGDRHNRALAHAVALLAANIEQDAGQTWQTDPFAGIALLHGVGALLLRLIPAAEGPPHVPASVDNAAARMPPALAAEFRTPSGFGHMLAHHLLREIEAAGASPTDNEWGWPIFLSADRNALARVGSDLGLSNDKKGRTP